MHCHRDFPLTSHHSTQHICSRAAPVLSDIARVCLGPPCPNVSPIDNIVLEEEEALEVWACQASGDSI